jgi:hypothetical protein
LYLCGEAGARITSGGVHIFEVGELGKKMGGTALADKRSEG